MMAGQFLLFTTSLQHFSQTRARQRDHVRLLVLHMLHVAEHALHRLHHGLHVPSHAFQTLFLGRILMIDWFDIMFCIWPIIWFMLPAIAFMLSIMGCII